MSSLHEQPEPGAVDTLDDEITHLTCCLDETIALCGTPLDDGPCDDDAEYDCVVCTDLLHEAPAFCPVRPFCTAYAVPV